MGQDETVNQEVPAIGPCPSGQVMDPVSGQCQPMAVGPCPSGQIMDPVSGQCQVQLTPAPTTAPTPVPSSTVPTTVPVSVPVPVQTPAPPTVTPPPPPVPPPTSAPTTAPTAASLLSNPWVIGAAVGGGALLLLAMLAKKKSAKPNPRRRCHVGMRTQSLIFSKDYFDRSSARHWASSHGFHAGKVHETGDSYRLRQHAPSQFSRGSFRTISFEPGLKAVVGCPKR